MNELMYFYSNIDMMLFIFVRILFAINFLPIVTDTKLPVASRIGLSIVLTGIVFSSVPQTLVYSPTALGFFIVVMKEIIVGLIMSFSIMLFFQIYHYIGNLWSTQGGLGMSQVMDPSSGAQVPLIGRLYDLAFGVVFITSGGYHWFIRSLVESFIYIPLGESIYKTDLLGTLVDGIANFWTIGFILATPILAVLFIIDCGLGILARTVPQMNMFVIGLPLKLIVLLVLLVVTLNLMPVFNEIILDHIVDLFYNMMQGLSET